MRVRGIDDWRYSAGASMSHLRKLAFDLGKSQRNQYKTDKVLIRLILIGWFVFWIGLWWMSEH